MGDIILPSYDETFHIGDNPLYNLFFPLNNPHSLNDLQGDYDVRSITKRIIGTIPPRKNYSTVYIIITTTEIDVHGVVKKFEKKELLEFIEFCDYELVEEYEKNFQLV